MSYDPPGFGGGTPEVIIGVTKTLGDTGGFTANRAYAILCQTPVAVVLNRVGFSVSSQAGNLDVGLYDDDGTSGAPGTRLVSSGSTACPAVGLAQITVADTTVPAGKFWVVIATDSTSTGLAYFSTHKTLLPATGGAAITDGGLGRDSSFPLPSTMGAMSVIGNMPCAWGRYVP